MALFEQVIMDKINAAQRASKLAPLVLGGVGGEEGGIGGPPGGFIGVLPQRRVAYDTTEAESFLTPSGASLIDNLNHIRYRLHQVEMGTVISGFVPTFLGLDDTPNTYAGKAGLGLRVKADETALEYVVLSEGVIPDFLGLSDTPDTYEGYSGMIPIVNETEDGLVFIPLSGLISISVSGLITSFIDLYDTPETYSGEAGNILVVNENEDGVEFITPSGLFSPILSGFTTTFIDLSDTPNSYTGFSGMYPVVNDLETGLEFRSISGITTSFLNLTDTPDSYIGYSGMIPIVNDTEMGLEFVSIPQGSYIPINKWEPDVEAASVHTLTDEFNDNSIDVSWNELIVPGDRIAFSENDLGLVLSEETIDFSSYKLQGFLWKVAPSGDFSVTTKINSYSFGPNIQAGIVVANGLDADYTNAQIHLLGWNYGDDGTGAEFMLMSGVSDILNWYIDSTGYQYPVGVYVRARYRASTNTLFYDISDNGISWLERSSVNPTLPPLEIGLSCRTRSYGESVESDGTDLSKEVYFQYFRVTDSANLVQVNSGKRI